jgi:hypothetical protein
MVVVEVAEANKEAVMEQEALVAVAMVRLLTESLVAVLQTEAAVEVVQAAVVVQQVLVVQE